MSETKRRSEFDARLKTVIKPVVKGEQHIEYLKEEITRIITLKEVNDVLLQRLRKLLDKMRIHYGPDPVNHCFQRFVRIAMKNMKLDIAILIYEKYIESSLCPFNEFIPDYLFLLFNYAKESEENGYDVEDFLQLVKALVPHADINGYYPSYRSSLIELIINCLDSDDVRHPSRLGICTEIAFEYIVTLPQLDVNLTEARKAFPRALLPLQVALNQLKFRASVHLIRRFADITSIDLTDVVFISSAEAAFKCLFYAGYPFPMASVLKQSMIIFEGDPHFESFILWLRKQQNKTMPLTCLSWVAIRRELGSEALSFYEDISQRFLFSEQLHRFIRLEGFQILK